MADQGEVTTTVLFTVTVICVSAEDGWFCMGKETGIVSRGATEDEAVDRNTAMHQAVVRRLKRHGAIALLGFMGARGIDFTLDEEPDDQSVFTLSRKGTRRVIEAAA